MLTGTLAVLQVDTSWRDAAQPFVSQHSQHFGSAQSDWRRCFEWATAVVAAYSFELGDDKFQVRVLANRQGAVLLSATYLRGS